MEKEKTRVRFAPSPMGLLPIAGYSEVTSVVSAWPVTRLQSFSGRSNYIWTSKARSVQDYETPTQGVGGNRATNTLKDAFAAGKGKEIPGIRSSPVRYHEGWLIVDLGKSGRGKIRSADTRRRVLLVQRVVKGE